jgi:hypothetical protein
MATLMWVGRIPPRRFRRYCPAYRRPGSAVLGDAQTERDLDTNPAWMAETFQFQARISAQVRYVSMFADHTSNGDGPIVGIYADADNSPETLHSQTPPGRDVARGK